MIVGDDDCDIRFDTNELTDDDEDDDEDDDDDRNDGDDNDVEVDPMNNFFVANNSSLVKCG
ncbi:hypothetical protein DERF_002128 [Dermatophagoides farinae]|uniref:Uncharacterized protein n=1 Tax=Dermatophagoides farinae TaxID=6954 RepID=A0A922LA57_DERFA|nr:hypothetical protein DERF_002128 [Dermatophagoides farinae]